jgi:ribosomal protein L13
MGIKNTKKQKIEHYHGLQGTKQTTNRQPVLNLKQEKEVKIREIKNMLSKSSLPNLKKWF